MYISYITVYVYCLSILCWSRHPDPAEAGWPRVTPPWQPRARCPGCPWWASACAASTAAPRPAGRGRSWAAGSRAKLGPGPVCSRGPQFGHRHCYHYQLWRIHNIWRLALSSWQELSTRRRRGASRHLLRIFLLITASMWKLRSSSL